jgi:hypothetical protein
MNWKTIGSAALLSIALGVASDLSASPVFDGTNANVWVQEAPGVVRSYGLGSTWTTGASVNAGVASVLLDGGQSRNLQVGGAATSILVNQTAQSVPMLSPSQIPLALAGLNRGAGDPDQGSALPSVEIQPAGGRFEGTVPVVLRAARAQGLSSNLTIRWSVNGGAQQTRVFNSTQNPEVRFFLVDNGTHSIQSTAVQSGRVSPAVNASIVIENADPMRDTDGDGIPDAVEAFLGMDPLNDDLALDSDGDGWPDFEELLRGSDPNDPNSVPLDSDGDGWSDFDEILRGTNPNDPFTLVDGVKQPVLVPDRPTARRLYEVESLLDGEVLCGLDPNAQAKRLDGLTASGIGGNIVYDVLDLADETLLDDQPAPQKMQDLPEYLRRDLAYQALENGELPVLRLPAGESLVLRARDELNLRIKGFLPAYADPTPGEVTGWLAAQDRSWKTAEEWIDAYVEYLGERLVQSSDATLGPETGAIVALVESLVAWQASEAAGASLLGVPRAAADAIGVQRLRRLLADNDGDVAELARRLAELPELADARRAIAAEIRCEAEENTEALAYARALGLSATDRYLSRLLVLEDLDALKGPERALLADPNADADGDGIENIRELDTPEPSDPRVSDTPSALPRISAADLRVREPATGTLLLPVILRLESPSSDVVSLRYASHAGTATAGLDFVAVTGTASFPPGVTEVQINIQILADAETEPDEQFQLRLSSVQNATLVRNSITITIEDASAATGAPLAQDDLVVVEPGSVTDIDVLSNDDGRGSPLSVTLHSTPAAGSAVVLADGRIRYTAPAEFVGGTEFRYRIENADGEIAIATVSVRSTQQDNQPPIALDDEAVTRPDTSVFIDVLANDSDPDGDMLTLSIVRKPDNGTATLVGGGIEYSPAPGFVGKDSLRYRIEDGRGGMAEAEVTISVEGVAVTLSLAPDFSVTEPESGEEYVDVRISLSQPSPEVVRVDYYTVGETATPLHDFTVVFGTAIFNPGETKFDIRVGIAADDKIEDDETFRIELANAQGASIERGMVRITILDGTPRNTAPVARDDKATVQAGGSVDINVLANDEDADGDPLTVALVSQPASGEAELLADGRIRYTAATGFAGLVSFDYSIDDGRGGTDRATVRVLVGSSVGGFVIYALNRSGDSSSVTELYRLPLAAEGDPAVEPLRITPDFPEGDNGVQGFWLAPDGQHVIYQGRVPGTFNSRYYLITLGENSATTVPLSPLPHPDASLAFSDPKFTRDGKALIYRLFGTENSFVADLVMTPLSAPGTAIVLKAGSDVEIDQFLLDPELDVAYVVTQRDFSGGAPAYVGRLALDGSGTLDRLSPDFSGFMSASGFTLSADGRWLVYRIGSGSSFDPDAVLYGIDLHDGATVVRLTPDFQASGGFGLGYPEHLVAPDGSRVYFVADIGEVMDDGQRAFQELYQVELAPPHKLTRLSALSQGDIFSFRMTPDGRYLAYPQTIFDSLDPVSFLRVIDRDLPGVQQTAAGPLANSVINITGIPGSIGFDAITYDNKLGDLLMRSLIGSSEPQFITSGDLGDDELSGISSFISLSDGRHVLYSVSNGPRRGLNLVDTHKPDANRRLTPVLGSGEGIFLFQVYEQPQD